MILLYLILGHLLADFVFQPDKLIVWKNKSWKGVFVHAFIHFSIETLLLLPLMPFHAFFPALLGIVILHFAIDQIKIRLEHKKKSYVKFFFIDQFAHFFILALTYFIFFRGISVDGQRSLFLYIFTNLYLVNFVILAILVSFGIDIIQLQFSLQKDSSVVYTPSVSKILKRLLILSVAYIPLVFLSSQIVRALAIYL